MFSVCVQHKTDETVFTKLTSLYRKRNQHLEGTFTTPIQHSLVSFAGSSLSRRMLNVCVWIQSEEAAKLLKISGRNMSAPSHSAPPPLLCYISHLQQGCESNLIPTSRFLKYLLLLSTNSDTS